jgi:hypothetical protein
VIPSLVSLAHLVSTLLMVGVIVYVQVVHYPLMSRVGPECFVDYERGHASRRVPAWIGGGLLAVIWLSTATLQAPAHGRLARGFDARVHRRLVVSNWIRTVAWVARIPVAVALAT